MCRAEDCYQLDQRNCVAMGLSHGAKRRKTPESRAKYQRAKNSKQTTEKESTRLENHDETGELGGKEEEARK